MGEMAGVPLKRAIMASYLIQIETGEVAHTAQELFERISKIHEDHGGLPCAAKDPQKEAAKALAELRDQGYYTQPHVGRWRRSEKIAPDDEALGDSIQEAEVTVGDGDQCLYAWYLPTYRKMANINDEPTFAMKIGISGRAAIERISESMGFSPEPFALGFMLLTDNPQDWESLYHSTLNLKGRHRERAHGTEWYNTNPQELLEIFECHNKLFAIENRKAMGGLDRTSDAIKTLKDECLDHINCLCLP